MLGLWSVMSAGGEATRVGAKVRPDAVEAEEETGEPVSDVACASEGLPEQERENCRSEFERFPGRGRFHVRAGRDESRPAVGTTALADRPEATLYVPWAEG